MTAPTDAALLARVEAMATEYEQTAAECIGTGHHACASDLRALIARVRELEDYPDLDATDGAHPAWWRGHEHGAESICREVTKILDGAAPLGTCWEPWQTVRKRVVGLLEERAVWHSLLGTHKRALDAATRERDEMKALVIEGWNAVSASYEQALAEYQNHDRRAARFDEIVRAWRKKARPIASPSALAPTPAGGE